MKKRLISLATVLALCLTFLPVGAFAQDRAQETTVTDWTEFERALQDPSCTMIKLGKDISSPQGSSDDAVFIGQPSRELTINGNGYQMTLNAGGIVLGGNTTMENLTIKFANATRNAIIANGYTLTLNNITNAQQVYPINVFCGAITDYNSSNQNQLPSSGTHGQLIVQNKCELGDIFAGSMSDGPTDAQATENEFKGQATITLEQSFDQGSSKIGRIYAHGAREPRDGSNPGGMIPDPDKYQVSGSVKINIYGSKAKEIDGNTGKDQTTKASVAYHGSNNLDASMQLVNLGGLIVESGELEPKSGSSFAPDAVITVKPGAKLSFKQYPNPLTIGDFSGGGGISLEPSQHLQINGAISGQTKVAIGGFKGEDASWGTPQNGKVQITAPQSQSGAFTLLAQNFHLEWGSGGTWTVKSGSVTPTVTEVKNFKITSPKNVSKTQAEMIEEYFDASCEFTDASTQKDFTLVPLKYTVAVGGNTYSAATQPGANTATIAELNLSFEHGGDDQSGAYIYIARANPDQVIPAGDYTIQIDVPLVGGNKATETITLHVTGDAPLPPTPPHQHQWKITAQGEKLLAVCNGAGTCDLGNKADVTLIAPSDLIYSGQGKVVSKQGDIPGITLDAVKYRKAEQTLDQATEAAPVEPGTYVASLTHDGQTASLEFTITKKNAQALTDISLSEKYTRTEVTAHQIGAQMPSDAGALTYTVGTPNPANKVKNADKLAVTDGSMTVQLQNVQENDRITIPVTIASQHYEDSKLNIILTMTSKENQKPIVFNPPASMVYGTKINLTATGGTVSGITYEVQPGTGNASLSGSELTATKAGDITVRAHNPGDEHYNEVYSDWKKITIEQAMPSGQPKYTAITADGKKLADAKLTADDNSFNVKGKVAWADSEQTNVMPNTAYEWIFTPDDSNYKELRGKITPYQKDSGGSSSNVTPPIQRPNPDGSVTTTEFDKATGAKIETTRDKNGTTVKVVTNKNGAVEEVRSEISRKSVEMAAQNNQSIKLPAVVPVSDYAAEAPEIAVRMAVSGSVKLEVPVDHLTASTVLVIVHKGGREEIVKKSAMTQDGLSIDLSDDITLKVVDRHRNFVDVNTRDWYSQSVDFAASRDLMSGGGSGKFAPNTALSRGMLAAILHNLENNPAANVTGDFQDIQEDSWYANAVYWAAEEGILSGYSNGMLRPNENITREQLAVMLYRYMGSPKTSSAVKGFSDMDQISGYAREALSWAVDNGIMSGRDTGKLDPKGQATRAETAAMLMRFINLQ